MFFRYTVKWSDDYDHGVDKGITFAESYGDAARKIEDYYGPTLCNLRLGEIESEFEIGLSMDQLKEISDEMIEEEG